MFIKPKISKYLEILTRNDTLARFKTKPNKSFPTFNKQTNKQTKQTKVSPPSTLMKVVAFPLLHN